MANIPSHIVDEIIQTSRIEEVIGEFVELKRSGASLKGLSPFTDNKKNTLVVSPSKQIFKCFYSDKGGSVVTFLMETQNLSYPEALKWLADKYGIQIPVETATKTQIPVTQNKKKLSGVSNGKYTEYYPGGEHVKLEGLQDNSNKRQGVWNYYSEDGVHLSMIEYRNGLKHGIFLQKYSSGIVRRTGNYKNDKQVGEWTYYSESGIRTEIKDFSK
ncbi:MAG: CHC2 zinc finger domain-containing protein [Crocinitomicaceae bacterium]|nr:CHC2 zinc finger domain-containing protein [Crocinitomicaceae bacterium]